MKYSWSLIAASNSFHIIWEFSLRFRQRKEFSTGSRVFPLIRSQWKSKKYSVYMNRSRSSLFRYSSAATVFKILSSIFFQVAPAQNLLTFADVVCGSLVSNFRCRAAEWPDSPRQYPPKKPAVRVLKTALPMTCFAK